MVHTFESKVKLCRELCYPLHSYLLFFFNATWYWCNGAALVSQLQISVYEPCASSYLTNQLSWNSAFYAIINFFVYKDKTQYLAFMSPPLASMSHFLHDNYVVFFSPQQHLSRQRYLVWQSLLTSHSLTEAEMLGMTSPSWHTKGVPWNHYTAL